MPTAVPEEQSFEKQMWDYLVDQYENEYAAAALMANSNYEMALCSYRTEGDKVMDENGEYPFSKEYTKKVDSGEISRSDFAYSGPNGGGYGLFSWTGVGRKENLYDFAKERGCSISDWQMQLDFAYEEIVERYHELYCTLLTAENCQEATESFGMIFERGEKIGFTVLKRTDIANEYYEKYGSASFEPKFEKGELLPVNHSYDYMENKVEENTFNTSIFPYIAEVVLAKNGYLDKEPAGYCGTELKEAILKLQKDHGVEQDGVLDQETWEILEQL